MNLARKILGPKSKYDQTLPFTYYAVAHREIGFEEFTQQYYADTICGLVRYLDKKNIPPEAVNLYGAYANGKDQELEISSCLDQNGNWLYRPDICESMETCYKNTKNDCYRGHFRKGRCNFDDRSRAGSGPY
jgi:hypothetical protein